MVARLNVDNGVGNQAPAIGGHLRSACFEQILRRYAVPGQEAVHAFRRGVARCAAVDERYCASGTQQNQRGT